MKQLDMLGKPCPIPVVEARKALEKENAQAVRLLVDNEVAVENLRKMATGQGYTFAHEILGENRFAVEITRGSAPAPAAGESPAAGPVADGGAGGPVVLVSADSMGRGSEELGRMLVKGFIYSLTELSPPPQSVIFVNNGAFLTTEGANTLEDLHTLEDKGVEILTCGTCLNYNTLTDKLAVGGVTDMMGITTRLAAAPRLISL